MNLWEMKQMWLQPQSGLSTFQSATWMIQEHYEESHLFQKYRIHFFSKFNSDGRGSLYIIVGTYLVIDVTF